MCVLCAYVGSEPAAPILLDMLARMEGLGGGYYTGLATVHGGQVHHEKVVGDVAALRTRTAAEALPGTLGLAHSRTPSGGDATWAHPFVSGAEGVAYVANGAMGYFDGRTDYTAAGNRLLERGYSFTSAVPEAIPPYPSLDDGNSVHFSEIMALLIEDNRRSGRGLLAAGAQAFDEWPSEIVALAVAAAEPDSFVALRINQPLVIGSDYQAMYAATTSLAFPDGVSWQAPMPPNAAAAVSREGLELRPLRDPVLPVAAMPAATEVCRLIVPALLAEPQSIGGLCNLVRELWPEGALQQGAMLVYQTVAGLVAAGQAELVTATVPGMGGAGTAPQTKVRWLG